MKHLFLAVIATGLIFATSCKKEEITPPPASTHYVNGFDENDWTLIQKNYKEDGMVGDLFQSKTDKNQTLFLVNKNLTRAVGGSHKVTGTYYKKIIHPDPYDPTIIATVHYCDGNATNCYIDDNGGLVVLVHK